MPLAARICLWPPALAFLAVASIFMIVSIGSLLLSWRLQPPPGPEPKDPVVAGAYFGFLAVIYAVLLAFVAISVWDSYNQALLTSEQESAALLAVARSLNTHPHPTPPVRRLLGAVGHYARCVVDQEYPAMGRMERSSETVEAFQQVWAAANALDPATSADSNIQQNILANLNDAQRARVTRLLLARRGLPAVLWIVIICGGWLALGFGAFFHGERFWPLLIMNAILGLSVSLVVFAIVELNYPYLGSVSVAPEGFNFVIRHTPQGFPHGDQ